MIASVSGKVMCKPSMARSKTVVRSGDKDEIYIGFPKNDYDRSEGRKGRVIKGDPAKYPSRDGMFTGGWAGGEAGLWQFREQIEAEKKGTKSSGPMPKPNGSPAAGKTAQYVGFGKDQLDLKNTGVAGRFVYDDDEKYPTRSEITGGFAGGEVGLKSFAATGEVKLRKPGQAGVKQQESPLAIGFLLLLAGATAAVVLTVVSGGDA
eukprot:gene13886-19812_t